MLARALSDATKVDSQSCNAGVVQSGSRAKHNFIVHSAATEWMWMKHESRSVRWLLPRLFENCFQLSVFYGYEKVAGGIHITTFDAQHKSTRTRPLVGSFYFFVAEARTFGASVVELCGGRFNGGRFALRCFSCFRRDLNRRTQLAVSLIRRSFSG